MISEKILNTKYLMTS